MLIFKEKFDCFETKIVKIRPRLNTRGKNWEINNTHVYEKLINDKKHYNPGEKEQSAEFLVPE